MSLVARCTILRLILMSIDVESKFNGGAGYVLITKRYEDDERVIGLNESEWLEVVRAGLECRWDIPND